MCEKTLGQLLGKGGGGVGQKHSSVVDDVCVCVLYVCCVYVCG